MAESIKTQIGDLTGFASDDNALQDWCDAGAKEIINTLPPGLIVKCITTSALSNSPSTLTNFDTRGKVFAVTRSDGTRQRPCREISPLYRGMVDDSSDIINYATTSDPVFLKYNNTLYVYPVPTSSQNAYIEHTSYPTVNMASSAIGNFPDDAEYLVVLYAACRALQRLMNDKSSDLPSNLSVPVLGDISTSLPTFTAPDDFISPVKPSVPSLSAQSVTITGTAPTYVKPSFSAPSLGSVGDLVLPVTPTVPSLSVQTNSGGSVFGSTTAPTYVKPVRAAQTAFSAYTTGLSETDPGLFSLNAVAPAVPASPSFTTPDVASVTVTDLGVPPQYTSPTISEASSLSGQMADLTGGQIGVDNDFTQFDMWFTALGEMIEDDEDIELASVQIEKINSYISAYNIQMQDSLNKFNKEGAEYTAKIQEGIEQAQINAQEAQNEANLLLQKEMKEYSSKLQRYQSELSTYQQNIAKEVQEYSTQLSHYQLELGVRHQAWGKAESDNISAYQADIQNAMNNFNKENVSFQANMQEAVQETQLKDVNETRKLQKYQAEVQTYQAEVNAKVQEWVNEEWNQNFQKYQTDYASLLQEYQVNSQNALNNFNDANVEYQAKLQKDIQDAKFLDSNETKKLQKYQAEVATYSAELNTNIQIFTQDLTKNRASFDTTLQKYQSESQKVTSDNQMKVQKFSAEVADYNAQLQKNTVDYTWLQGQYVQLKADYQQGLQMLISGGIPQQQQENKGR